jgi:hypothetical protein
VLILGEDGTPLAASQPAFAEGVATGVRRSFTAASTRTAWIGRARREVEVVTAQTDPGRVQIAFIGEVGRTGRADIRRRFHPACRRPRLPARSAWLPTGGKQGAGVRLCAPAPPVRFVFTVDADQRVTMLSPEFATVVGPEPADIVGQRWPEIAERIGVDGDGAVGRALACRDTWSGITVHWPAAGTDLAVPVDLAALPAFARSRTFEGFRGFGVCRPADAMPRGAAVAPGDDKAKPAGAAIHVLPGRGRRQPMSSGCRQNRMVRQVDRPTSRAGRPRSGRSPVARRRISARATARRMRASRLESRPSGSGGDRSADARPVRSAAIIVTIARSANRAFLDHQATAAAFERASGLAMFMAVRLGDARCVDERSLLAAAGKQRAGQADELDAVGEMADAYCASPTRTNGRAAGAWCRFRSARIGSMVGDLDGDR